MTSASGVSEAKGPEKTRDSSGRAGDANPFSMTPSATNGGQPASPGAEPRQATQDVRAGYGTLNESVGKSFGKDFFDMYKGGSGDTESDGGESKGLGGERRKPGETPNPGETQNHERTPNPDDERKNLFDEQDEQESPFDEQDAHDHEQDEQDDNDEWEDDDDEWEDDDDEWEDDDDEWEDDEQETSGLPTSSDLMRSLGNARRRFNDPSHDPVKTSAGIVGSAIAGGLAGAAEAVPKGLLRLVRATASGSPSAMTSALTTGMASAVDASNKAAIRAASGYATPSADGSAMTTAMGRVRNTSRGLRMQEGTKQAMNEMGAYIERNFGRDKVSLEGDPLANLGPEDVQRMRNDFGNLYREKKERIDADETMDPQTKAAYLEGYNRTYTDVNKKLDAMGRLVDKGRANEAKEQKARMRDEMRGRTRVDKDTYDDMVRGNALTRASFHYDERHGLEMMDVDPRTGIPKKYDDLFEYRQNLHQLLTDLDNPSAIPDDAVKGMGAGDRDEAKKMVLDRMDAVSELITEGSKMGENNRRKFEEEKEKHNELLRKWHSVPWMVGILFGDNGDIVSPKITNSRVTLDKAIEAFIRAGGDPENPDALKTPFTPAMSGPDATMIHQRYMDIQKRIEGDSRLSDETKQALMAALQPYIDANLAYHGSRSLKSNPMTALPTLISESQVNGIKKDEFGLGLPANDKTLNGWSEEMMRVSDEYAEQGDDVQSDLFDAMSASVKVYSGIRSMVRASGKGWRGDARLVELMDDAKSLLGIFIIGEADESGDMKETYRFDMEQKRVEAYEALDAIYEKMQTYMDGESFAHSSSEDDESRFDNGIPGLGHGPSRKSTPDSFFAGESFAEADWNPDEPDDVLDQFDDSLFDEYDKRRKQPPAGENAGEAKGAGTETNQTGMNQTETNQAETKERQAPDARKFGNIKEVRERGRQIRRDKYNQIADKAQEFAQKKTQARVRTEQEQRASHMGRSPEQPEQPLGQPEQPEQPEQPPEQPPVKETPPTETPSETPVENPFDRYKSSTGRMSSFYVAMRPDKPGNELLRNAVRATIGDDAMSSVDASLKKIGAMAKVGQNKDGTYYTFIPKAAKKLFKNDPVLDRVFDVYGSDYWKKFSKLKRNQNPDAYNTVFKEQYQMGVEKKKANGQAPAENEPDVSEEETKRAKDFLNSENDDYARIVLGDIVRMNGTELMRKQYHPAEIPKSKAAFHLRQYVVDFADRNNLTAPGGKLDYADGNNPNFSPGLAITLRDAIYGDPSKFEDMSVQDERASEEGVKAAEWISMWLKSHADKYRSNRMDAQVPNPQEPPVSEARQEPPVSETQSPVGGTLPPVQNGELLKAMNDLKSALETLSSSLSTQNTKNSSRNKQPSWSRRDYGAVNTVSGADKMNISGNSGYLMPPENGGSYSCDGFLYDYLKYPTLVSGDTERTMNGLLRLFSLDFKAGGGSYVLGDATGWDMASGMVKGNALDYRQTHTREESMEHLSELKRIMNAMMDGGKVDRSGRSLPRKDLTYGPVSRGKRMSLYRFLESYTDILEHGVPVLVRGD